MTKKWKKIAAVAVTTVMAATSLAALSACTDPDEPPVTPAVFKKGTYRTYTDLMPADWNELTSADANDVQIMNYIGSPFYEYDYKFDEAKGGKYKADGSINVDAIDIDSYTVQYSAATKLEDVTSSVDAKWGYTAAQKTSGGYAYKITLRSDLKWDDGTAIHAKDFVYSMQEQLNPDFKHYRANSFYDQVSIINSKNYLYRNDQIIYEALSSHGYDSVQAALDAGQTVCLNAWGGFGLAGAQKLKTYDESAKTWEVDEDAPTMTEWVDIKDEVEYLDPAIYGFLKEDGSFDETAAAAKNMSFSDFIVSGKILYEAYAGLLTAGGSFDGLYIGVAITNNNMGTEWDTVGIYAASTDELVVCLNKPLQLLNSDGSLNWQAAYYMQNLPLVKKDLFESCKQQPALGSSLWTTNYNSSKDTTASWGPYKLTSFQSGKSYTLEKNEYWYGYNMEEYKNQYNVTKIECESIQQQDTKWMKFLSGQLDDCAIDSAHADDYKSSKYATVTPSTGTMGIQLSGNLEALKKSGRNNGICAITEFRKAVSLALNREDFNETCSTANKACFGVLNNQYYSDIGNNQVYRETDRAKEALLKAYGYTKNQDGTWSNGGNITNATLNDAYESLGGSNMAAAKAELQKAITELTTNAAKYGYDSSKNITLLYGTGADTASTRKYQTYLQNLFNELTKDTALAGKIKVDFKDYKNGWSSEFRSGSYEICLGGFSNAPFNVGYMIGAHIDPDSTYHTYWNNEQEEISVTMPAGTYEGAGQSYTMKVMNLYRCLNGNAEKTDQYKFNWGAGFIPESARLEVVATIEEYILNSYYFIPFAAAYDASLTGAKFSNLTKDYNVMMAYGGMRYVVVNYTDSEWTDYVNSKGGNLESEYKKTPEI